ncbi:MAG: Gfo/Idh/MocA family oxidoreductase [Bryobacterales bacterium]|nr:Gfo/Idh/MocA family oxidoreductase [Bryobacterales bacterium]
MKKKPPEVTRRSFNRSAFAAAAAAPVRGMNGRPIRLGVIGTGPRGQYLMKELNKTRAVEWGAVCDIYNVRRDQAATIGGAGAKTYNEYQAVLDRKDIDAVVVATPDHWHATITIAACQAGKDVYVEKPMVHKPEDGVAVVRAARHNRRIVQVGMQGRAMPHFLAARDSCVTTGLTGKVGLIRTWYNGNNGYVLRPPPGMETQPAGLDWKRWLGPGPQIPWNPDVYFSPYKWLHYDGGMIMGIGIHVIDAAHQFQNLTKPSEAVCLGGIYQYEDRDTPDVVNIILEYPQKLNVTFEAELMTCATQPPEAGIELRGTGGILRVNRYDQALGWEFRQHPAVPGTPASASVQARGSSSSPLPLLRNWLECIQTRNRPLANEEQGYYSAAACYMGLEAYRTRSRVSWNASWNLPA